MKKKQKKLTTTKLFRMTDQQKLNTKGAGFSYVVQLLAEHWGSRKAKIIEDMIYTTFKVSNPRDATKTKNPKSDKA